VLYWLLSKNLREQNILLLLASYFFYGWWDYRFLALILFSSIIDYHLGLWIYKASEEKRKKAFLRLSLICNLGLLGVFKYFNFFSDSFAASMSTLGWEVDALTLNLILPVGISFYTFQTMSYTLDIYRGTFKPTKNVISFFTYVSFFPQLVAGPIERASNLIPQIEKLRTFKLVWFKEGVVQIFMGLFRKIVIADNLGVYADPIFNNPDLYNTPTLVLAVLFYAFQIYYDFAGYSDIAIGSAKLLGFKFHQNFNLPYFSKSITEFWRRWHMSLSYWLRDYLYISLGGNRRGVIITYRNLMLTMLLGGLWHGSSWNFVVWGAIHGIALSLEKFVFSRLNIKNFAWWGYLYTFSIVLLAWIFFRAETFEKATDMILGIFRFELGMPFLGNVNAMSICLFSLVIGVLIDWTLFRNETPIEEIGGSFSFKKIVLFISIAIFMIIFFYSTTSNFIYFQF